MIGHRTCNQKEPNMYTLTCFGGKLLFWMRKCNKTTFAVFLFVDALYMDTALSINTVYTNKHELLYI